MSDTQKPELVISAIRRVIAEHRTTHEAWCVEETREARLSGFGHTYTTAECYVCRGTLEEDLIAAVAAIRD